MPINRYRELPLEALYNLLVKAVGELLDAADSGGHDFKAKLKETELIYAAIQSLVKSAPKKG